MKKRLLVSIFLFTALSLTACINDSSESSKAAISSQQEAESSSEIIVSSSEETPSSVPVSSSEELNSSEEDISSSDAPVSSSQESQSSEHIHVWNTKWSYDDDYHWHACSGCSEIKDKEAHVWEVVVKMNPTATDEGMIAYECDGCGCTKTEILPPTGSGN